LPTTIFPAAAATLATNSPTRPRGIIARLVAVHFWPVEPKAPSAAYARQRLPHLARAGERYRFNVLALAEDVAQLGARAVDQVGHARRQAGIRQALEEADGGERGIGGGLKDDDVAGDQGRRQLPGRDGDGEVPRRDEGDDAQRLAKGVEEGVAAVGGDGPASQPAPLAGEEVEYLRRAQRLPSRLAEGLALLAGEVAAYVVGALAEQGRRPGQVLAPSGRRRVAPGRKSFLRGFDGLQSVGATRTRMNANQLADVGGVGVLVELAAGRRRPAAVYVVIVAFDHFYFASRVLSNP
jgi:hypothetical protein